MKSIFAKFSIPLLMSSLTAAAAMPQGSIVGNWELISNAPGFVKGCVNVEDGMSTTIRYKFTEPALRFNGKVNDVDTFAVKGTATYSKKEYSEPNCIGEQYEVRGEVLYEVKEQTDGVSKIEFTLVEPRPDHPEDFKPKFELTPKTQNAAMLFEGFCGKLSYIYTVDADGNEIATLAPGEPDYFRPGLATNVTGLDCNGVYSFPGYGFTLRNIFSFPRPQRMRLAYYPQSVLAPAFNPASAEFPTELPDWVETNFKRVQDNGL